MLRALTLGLKDDKTRRRLLEQSGAKLTLDKALQKCRAAEDSKEYMKAIKDAVQSVTAQAVKHMQQSQGQGQANQSMKSENVNSINPVSNAVIHMQDKDVLHFVENERNCLKLNHFEKMCRSKKSVHVINTNNLGIKVDQLNRKPVGKVRISSSDAIKQVELSFQLYKAYSSILSFTDNCKLKKPEMIESTATLTMYDSSEVKPMVKCRLIFHTTKGKSFMFQITKTKNMSLLLLDSCIELGLLSIN